MKSWRKGLLVLSLAALSAAGVVLLRSADAAYQIEEWMARGRFDEHDTLIAETGIEPALVKALVWHASRFDSRKTGADGGRGLMQVREADARDWAAAEKIETLMLTDLFDARTNLRAGTWRLARAMERWKEREDAAAFALAEHLGGQERARGWSRESRTVAELLAATCDEPVRIAVEEILRRREFYRQR